MARKPLPKATETAVLVRSRRRCCICFGLGRDTKLKAGQIAHLDKNSANHAEDNLAFLCFAHHDEYDSTTSQRKNFTLGEVKSFRDELDATINRAFTQQVHFGEITTPPEDPYAGSYTRLGSGADSAVITLTPLPDSVESVSRYFVSGEALYGTLRPNGPNLGFLEFVGSIEEEDIIVDQDQNWRGEVQTTVLKFFDGLYLKVTEMGCEFKYGMNVSFIGTYKRLA